MFGTYTYTYTSVFGVIQKHLTPIFFNVKHILYKIVTCTVHIKMYNIRLSKVLQGFLMQ